jgi:two-component system, chemotaxis family, response regulator Rcp1
MTTPIQILLVEDNPGDADLTRESLAASKLRIELTVAVSGAEALEFIHKRGRFSSASSPDLILLDLNLPGIDGRAVLEDIKQDADLKRIPVCILTSSAAETDVVHGYNLGANCYVVKPIDFKTFQNIVQAVEGFWFTLVKLPCRQQGARRNIEGGDALNNR